MNKSGAALKNWCTIPGAMLDYAHALLRIRLHSVCILQVRTLGDSCRQLPSAAPGPFF